MVDVRRSNGSAPRPNALRQAARVVRRLTIFSVMMVVILGSALLWTASQVAGQIDTITISDDHARLSRALEVAGQGPDLTAERLVQIAGLTGMQSPRVASVASAVHAGESAIEVTPELTLIWTPQHPGAQLFKTFAPIRIPMIVLMAAGLLGVIAYLNRLARLLDAQRRETAELAAADSLTGLSNRLGFDTALTARFTPAPLPTTLLYLDLDGFKTVNDTFGHAAGDNILRSIAARLRTYFPDALSIARIGGDEFAVLLEGVHTQATLNKARRTRNQLRIPFQSGDRRTEVGLSIGIAEAPEHGLTPKTLLAMADAALYRAKAQNSGVSRAMDAPPAGPDDHLGPHQNADDPSGIWTSTRSNAAASK